MEVKGLVDEKYFEGIQRGMERAGFELISKVQIDSANDIPYHVPVTYARNTSLFFRLPNKSLVIQMVFDENDYLEKGRISSHWVVKLYTQYKKIEKLVEIKIKLGVEEIPLMNYGVDLDGFYENGGSSGWDGNFCQVETNYEQKRENGTFALLSAEKLSKCISALVDKIKSYLSTFFRELQITDFPPCYTFPGSEKMFWERFDIEKLVEFVYNPWGDDELKSLLK